MEYDCYQTNVPFHCAEGGELKNTYSFAFWSGQAAFASLPFRTVTRFACECSSFQIQIQIALVQKLFRVMCFLRTERVKWVFRESYQAYRQSLSRPVHPLARAYCYHAFLAPFASAIPIWKRENSHNNLSYGIFILYAHKSAIYRLRAIYKLVINIFYMK